jgi:hypothetical protein
MKHYARLQQTVLRILEDGIHVPICPVNPVLNTAASVVTSAWYTVLKNGEASQYLAEVDLSPMT